MPEANVDHIYDYPKGYIEDILKYVKTIAMVGVSSIKKEVSTNIRRRPSTIVMKYMQEFGYRVIPVNPFSAGEKVHGETIVANLNDNYEGAEFYCRGKKIPLKTGDILLFPSTFMYPHEVKEATKGTRYSFVSWAF